MSAGCYPTHSRPLPPEVKRGRRSFAAARRRTGVRRPTQVTTCNYLAVTRPSSAPARAADAAEPAAASPCSRCPQACGRRSATNYTAVMILCRLAGDRRLGGGNGRCLGAAGRTSAAHPATETTLPTVPACPAGNRRSHRVLQCRLTRPGGSANGWMWSGCGFQVSVRWEGSRLVQ